MKPLFFLLLLAASPGIACTELAFAGDAERGRIVAGVRCIPCHHLHLESNLIGPGLKDIYNRAPRMSGVPYARWDEASLDEWLANPRAIKPNTKMAIPPIAKRDREDLIAYFEKDSGKQ